MFSVAADGIIADDGTVDCVIEIEMDIGQVKQLCVSLVDLDLSGCEGQLLDELKDFNRVIVDDVVDLCLKIETSVKTLRTEGFAHPACFEDAAEAHLNGQRCQLSCYLLAELSGLI